jgi:2-polyprenyl-6-hydroxyphenyl methylase/3-demethylubiquinone-9 3-methyltransferase
MNEGYYAAKLSGDRLRRCYEIAPRRVRQYLRSEIDFVLEGLGASDRVLELGCGYGRVALELAMAAGSVVGVDTSRESLLLARRIAGEDARCTFLEMDATELRFGDGEFDVVVCVQNGICAFRADALHLIREALRVTRAGGHALFSTYSARFWEHRLRWFEAQAAEGLLGAIDYNETGDGVIVCEDGFRAGVLTPEEFVDLGRAVGIGPLITEVDGSSVFADWRVPAPEDERESSVGASEHG